MFGFGLVLVIFGVWIYSVMDILTTHPSDVRLLSKPLWLLSVGFLGFLFVPAVVWLLCGRPRQAYSEDGYGHGAADRPVRRPGWDSPGPDPTGHPSGRARMRRPVTRPLAPDDDPEFLRELSERIRRGKSEDPPR